MNLGYRIVKADSSEHGILVRYWTDKVTEMDLATSFNEDGTVRVNADGYPLSTRTDVFMSIYETPAPSYEQIVKDIILRAPIDWLKLQESIVDVNVDTKLAELKEHVGDTGTFTLEDVEALRLESSQQAVANVNADITETVRIFDYANSDPKISSAFANLVIHAIHTGTTIPL